MNRRRIHSNLSTFLFSTFPIGHKHPRPSLLFATSSPLSPVYSYGGGSAPNDGHLCLLYTSLLVIHIPVHLYSPRLRRRFRRSILTAVMRPPPIIYYPEMAHITIIESHYALLMLSLFSFSNFFYDITHFIHFK